MSLQVLACSRYRDVLPAVRVGEGVGVEGDDIVALTPGILHRPLRIGGTLHHRWRVHLVWGFQPKQPTG